MKNEPNLIFNNKAEDLFLSRKIEDAIVYIMGLLLNSRRPPDGGVCPSGIEFWNLGYFERAVLLGGNKIVLKQYILNSLWGHSKV